MNSALKVEDEPQSGRVALRVDYSVYSVDQLTEYQRGSVVRMLHAAYKMGLLAKAREIRTALNVNEASPF